MMEQSRRQVCVVQRPSCSALCSIRSTGQNVTLPRWLSLRPSAPRFEAFRYQGPLTRAGARRYITFRWSGRRKFRVGSEEWREPHLLQAGKRGFVAREAASFCELELSSGVNDWYDQSSYFRY